MATKVFYQLSTLASGTNHYTTQEDGTVPTAGLFSPSVGFTMGTTAALRYARLDSQTIRTAASFGTTAEPSGAPDNTLGDSFRSPNPLSGTFASGNWTLGGRCRASATGTALGQAGRYRFRVWASSDPATPTREITTSTVTTNTSTAFSGVTVQQLSGTWAAPQFTLGGEYLFFQMAWEITTAATGATADNVLTVGPTAQFSTTDFQPAIDVYPVAQTVAFY